jgi:osmotically-inducible protein OsmY
MRHLALPVVLLVAVVAPGCAPIVVIGGGATAAMMAHDRRTAAAIVDDEMIELKSGSAVNADRELKERAHINATSFNGVLLLTGEAPTPEMRERVLARVRTVEKVKRVVDEIRVAEPSAFRDRSDDTWITGKVRTKLAGVQSLDSKHVKVVTENDVVYLLGLVYRREGELATEAARGVAGVTRVVQLFEYVD